MCVHYLWVCTLRVVAVLGTCCTRTYQLAIDSNVTLVFLHGTSNLTRFNVCIFVFSIYKLLYFGRCWESLYIQQVRGEGTTCGECRDRNLETDGVGIILCKYCIDNSQTSINYFIIFLLNCIYLWQNSDRNLLLHFSLPFVSTQGSEALGCLWSKDIWKWSSII